MIKERRVSVLELGIVEWSVMIKEMTESCVKLLG